MYNYSDLSDVEFEYLAHDVMEKRLGVSLHRFGKGCDGGIDLTDDVKSKNIIVQVKHYIKTPFAGLLTSLKKEVAKANKNNPKQYYVVCSCTLTPENTVSIFNLFKSYMISSHNIVSITDIDDYLNKTENHDIVKRHYKLWLSSTNLLSDIVAKDVFIDSQALLCKVRKQSKLYVETEAYRQALDRLLKRRILMLIGAPGVGKTITSEMLVLYFADKDYMVRYTTDGENLSGLKRSLSENPEQKEIILLDDCLGQCYFNMQETQENQLISLARYVNMSPNKILLMNSRVTIYREAQDKSPEFYKEIENGDLKVQIVDMTNISAIEKAKIFYNHLYFSNLPRPYFENIKIGNGYKAIIFHANFSPRIIEYVTMRSIENKVSASDYFTYTKAALDSPEDMWNNEFYRRLQPVDRMLLTTLYSLTDTLIESDMLKRCFNRRISISFNIDNSTNNWDISSNRLIESFIQVFSENGISKIGVINPSVNDFLRAHFTENSPERKELEKAVVSIKQAFRLLSNVDDFIKTIATDGSILDFEFEYPKLRDDYVIYCIIKYKIKNACYRNIVDSYFQNSHDIAYYDKKEFSKIDAITALLQPDMFSFYGIGVYLLDAQIVKSLLNDLWLNDLIVLINTLEAVVQNLSISRNDYMQLIKPYLKESVDWFTTDIDAVDASDGIDVSSILNSHSDFYGGFDSDGAESELEEILKASVESELVELLDTLPMEIAQMINVDKDVFISVNGADSVIGSYLEPDYDDDGYEGHGSSHDGGSDEIDYIFDR